MALSPFAKRAELLRRLTGVTKRAFLNALNTAQGRASVKAMMAAIDSGDIEAAMKAAGMQDGMWSNLTEAIRSSYHEGGTFAVSTTVPKRFGMEFNLGNPRAEQWLRIHSAELVTGHLMPEQTKAIQVMMEHGMLRGANPRTTALDIVGRISKQTGRRTGGVIGLTMQQSIFVNNMSNDLYNLDSRYFERRLRDKRYDKIVRASFDAGKPLPIATRAKLVSDYSDRMLRHRGEVVARTETLRAFNEAQDEAMRQVIDQGLAGQNDVTKVWKHSFVGKESRSGHEKMDGQEKHLDEMFTNPVTGATLKYPGDGPPSETINCRCVIQHSVDFIAVEGAPSTPSAPTPVKPKRPPVTTGGKPVSTGTRKPRGSTVPPVPRSKPLTAKQAVQYHADDAARKREGYTETSNEFVRQGMSQNDNMSAYLRGRTDRLTPDARRHLARISRDWDGPLTTKTTHDMTLFRGFSVNSLKNIQVGKTISDKGFWSTTVDRNVAKSFRDTDAKNVRVFLEIQTKAGTRVYNPLKYLKVGDRGHAIARTEAEFVLRPGSRIQILEVIEEPSSGRGVYLRVVARLVGEP